MAHGCMLSRSTTAKRKRSVWREWDRLSCLRMASRWQLGGRIRRCIFFPSQVASRSRPRGVEPGEFPTAWSSDGRSLFVMTRGQIPAQVFRVDVGTGQRTFWRSFEPADSAGIDTIRGVLVSADNKSYVYGYSRTLSDLYLVQGLK